MSRESEYGKLLAQHVLDSGNEEPELIRDGVETVDRFVLVEISRYDGTAWLTCWQKPEDAADYRDHQEYPDDRPDFHLIDLDDGSRHVPSIITSFPTVSSA